ncbi:MAG: hypothetical protein KC423_08240 [Anaerolineales bacterium]|nr:hypothetical protein [Anaerolineales bacterium]
MSNSTTFSGITYQRQPHADLIFWTNKDIPTHKPLLLTYGAGLLLLLPIAVFLTLRLVRDSRLLPNFIALNTGTFVFALLVIIITWVAVLGVAFVLLRLTWTERVLVGQDVIWVQYEGPLAFRDRPIPVAHIWRLSFERYQYGRDRESRYSVNILHQRRVTLAYWMRKEEAHQLFLLLSQIVQMRGWGELIQVEDGSGE